MEQAKAFLIDAASALPQQRYRQSDLSGAVCGYLEHHRLDFSRDVVRSLFDNVRIAGRHFEFPIDNFCAPPPVEQTAVQAIQACLAHTELAAREVLWHAGLRPRDIGLITSVTLTPAVPSLEARLMNRMAFSASTIRMPLAGLGCMAGAAGLNRAADYLHAYPKQAALVISCELSSALWQGSLQADLLRMIRELPAAPQLHAEIVMAIVTAALFGDGAGALLLVGREHRMADKAVLSVLDSRSNWVPDTEHIMGLDYVDAGMRNILRPEVKSFVGPALRDLLEPLLDAHQLTPQDLGHWTLHPGGPKIMDAAESAFSLSAEKMRLARDTLQEVGNISSATVLHMLATTLRQGRPPAGTPGLVVAMGPGFSQEAALVRWH